MKSSGSRRTRSSRNRIAVSVASLFAGKGAAGGGATVSFAADDDSRPQPVKQAASAAISKQSRILFFRSRFIVSLLVVTADRRPTLDVDQRSAVSSRLIARVIVRARSPRLLWRGKEREGAAEGDVVG